MKTLKVKFLSTCASKMVHYEQGEVVELAEEEAKELILVGRAEEAKEAPKLKK